MIEFASIIFCLKGREKYTLRYLLLCNEFGFKNKVFILKEPRAKNFGFTKVKGINYEVFKLENKVNGMADIFFNLHYFFSTYKDINFKYCHFVEDDNFIFPSFLDNCKRVFHQNKNIDGIIGNAFLHNNKGEILNHYNLPYFDDNDVSTRLKKYNLIGGLAYYSIFKTEKFKFLCSEVKNIKDDNLSEVLFNYLAVFKTKIIKLNYLFLAREYPRPLVYNIPSAEDWITSNNTSPSIKKFLEILKKTIKKDNFDKIDDIFDLTIKNYLALRFKTNEKKLKFNKLKNYLNLKNYSFNSSIKLYLEKIKMFD